MARWSVAPASKPMIFSGSRRRIADMAPAADLVLRNAKIITLDAACTIAEAIAVCSDRIAAVGPNDAMAAHIGPATRVVDLKDKPVIPGITDGHAHMDREGLRSIFPSLG